jgi:hypothetical protein
MVPTIQAAITPARSPQKPPPDPVHGTKKDWNKEKVNAVGKSGIASKEHVERSGQEGDQGGFGAKDREELRGVAGEPTGDERVEHYKAVGQIPGIVPGGRQTIQPNP